MRAGPYDVHPKSNNSDIVSVDDGISLGIDMTRRFDDHWALEVLAATPFTHDIKLLDGTKVGETQQLPPTVAVQYRFLPSGFIHPYAALGLNYTCSSRRRRRARWPAPICPWIAPSASPHSWARTST